MASLRGKLALYDDNKDGVVDEAEFVAAGGTKAEFEEYDRNKDGVLDHEELDRRAPG